MQARAVEIRSRKEKQRINERLKAAKSALPVLKDALEDELDSLHSRNMSVFYRLVSGSKDYPLQRDSNFKLHANILELEKAEAEIWKIDNPIKAKLAASIKQGLGKMKEGFDTNTKSIADSISKGIQTINRMGSILARWGARE